HLSCWYILVGAKCPASIPRLRGAYWQGRHSLGQRTTWIGALANRLPIPFPLEGNSPAIRQHRQRVALFDLRVAVHAAPLRAYAIVPIHPAHRAALGLLCRQDQLRRSPIRSARLAFRFNSACATLPVRIVDSISVCTLSSIRSIW